MKLAFCYMVHKMSPVLEHSVKILSEIGDIIVHVDKRININEFDSIKDYVTFTDNREAVRWAGFSQIKADVELLRMADKKDKYDYISMMSGECMPIKSNREIVEFLENHNGQEFISAIHNNAMINRSVKYIYPAYYSNKNRHLFQTLWILLTDRLPLIHRNPFLRENPYFKDLPKLYKGSNWFTITGDCNKYILDYLKENPYYFKAFEHSHCGDEVFFHTIVYNSPFFSSVFKGDEVIKYPMSQLRYIDWSTGPDFPRVLDNSDYKKMKDSNFLFSRKINANIDFKEFSDYFFS